MALLRSIDYNRSNAWMVSLWPGCLIKWLEKSDWLQGWCIIDERAWLIENILYSRGGCMSAWVCVCGWSKWLHFVWTTSSVSAQHSVLIVILHRHTLPNIYCMCNHKYGRSKWYYSHKHSPRGTMGIITLGNLHNVSWYYTMADICVGRLRALCISLDAGLLHLQHTGRVVWIKDEAVKRWTTGPKTN